MNTKKIYERCTQRHMLSMRNGCFLFGRSEFFVELSVSEITWTYKTNGKLKIELLFRVCDINHISQLSLNQTMIRRNIGLQNIHENRLNEYGEKEKVLARLRQSNWGTNYNEMNEYWCVIWKCEPLNTIYAIVHFRVVTKNSQKICLHAQRISWQPNELNCMRTGNWFDAIKVSESQKTNHIQIAVCARVCVRCVRFVCSTHLKHGDATNVK